MVGLVLGLVVAASKDDVHVTPGEALYDAIARDDARAARRAVQDGASLRLAVKPCGEPPLFYALDFSPGMFEPLCRMGAPVDGTDEYGRTLLHRLVSNEITWRENDRRSERLFWSFNGLLDIRVPWDRRERIASDLIRHGVSLEAKDRSGLTALHYAVQDDWHGVAMLLRLYIEKRNAEFRRGTLYTFARGGDQGAGPNVTDHDGETPLILLAKNEGWREGPVERKVIIAGLLIEAGADLTARDHDGKTAEEWARKNGDSVLAAVLEAKRKEPSGP